MTRKVSVVSTSRWFLPVVGAFCAFFTAFSLIASDGASDSVKIQTFKTHSRLIFKVDDGATIEKKNSGAEFEIFFKGLGLTDFGAALGEEEGWKSQFSRIDDSRIASLNFSEERGGLRVTGRWKFPTGAQAFAHPEMEWFDYRDKAPQYVVDFWYKKGPTLVEATAARQKAMKLAALRKAESEAKQRASRTLASAKVKTQVEDLGKFCNQPINDKSDIFLSFLPYHEKVDFTRWLSTKNPDNSFQYTEPSEKNPEKTPEKPKDAQYVRLALSLYRQGKPALVIRTLDFLENEVPQSSYLHEMRFLRANAMIKLGLHREADEVLARLMGEARETPAALYAGMYVAGNRVAKGSHLAALESFSWLINHHSDHPLSWVFHLGAAESLYGLKQTERAMKEYQWVVENASENPAKAEAALRMGDLYLDRLQYEQALGAYFQGLNHFGNEAKTFPAVHVNRGEALYHLGQYDAAKDAFETFLDRFSGHPAGWRAAFRLGEIHARREGENFITTGRKWFYETINRYPMSPGATLARLRLLPCSDHGGFTLDSMGRFMSKEADIFDGRGEVVMGQYRDFKGLAYVRALMTMGREDLAVSIALQELQTNKNSGAKDLFSNIMGTLFRKTILNYLAAGKKYEALTFYNEKKGMIARNLSEIEPDYLLKLSQAASDLGLGKVGGELVTTYQKILATRTTEGRTLASENQDLSEHNFTKAKAQWVLAGISAKAEVLSLLAGVTEESHYACEREVILGLIEEKDGKLASALAHAVRAQTLMPEKRDGRIDAWVASLQFRAGDSTQALDLYRKLEGYKRSDSSSSEVLGLPPVPSLDALILAQAEILEKHGRWGEAATAYGRAVEKGWGGNHALYGYAHALFKTGDRASAAKAKGALETLAKSKNDDFWRKLAVERLREPAGNFNEAKEGGK